MTLKREIPERWEIIEKRQESRNPEQIDNINKDIKILKTTIERSNTLMFNLASRYPKLLSKVQDKIKGIPKNQTLLKLWTIVWEMEWYFKKEDKIFYEWYLKSILDKYIYEINRAKWIMPDIEFFEAFDVFVKKIEEENIVDIVESGNKYGEHWTIGSTIFHQPYN